MSTSSSQFLECRRWDTFNFQSLPQDNLRNSLLNWIHSNFYKERGKGREYYFFCQKLNQRQLLFHLVKGFFVSLSVTSLKQKTSLWFRVTKLAFVTFYMIFCLQRNLVLERKRGFERLWFRRIRFTSKGKTDKHLGHWHIWTFSNEVYLILGAQIASSLSYHKHMKNKCTIRSLQSHLERYIWIMM